jgi:hydrogenase nickel incorporation protein HypB
MAAAPILNLLNSKSPNHSKIMCDNCGCASVESFNIIPMQSASGTATAEHNHGRSHGDGEHHHHHHVDEPNHEHVHEHHTHTLPVHLPLLQKNDRLAERNRGYLKARRLFAINIVSSPGAGKTALIAQTLERTAQSLPTAVIVGDLETANDAARLRDKGAPVVQVTTGTVCHLDADMVGHALEHLPLENRRLLIIENVGNLVCPASYDLGEALRVVLISVTEGEDKPLKYPPIFHGAGVVIISKMDMLEASGLEIEKLRRNIRAVSPDAEILELSTRTGEGMDQWIALLHSVVATGR